MGDQDVYAVVSGMKLYNRNVPYGNTDWVLCGFVSESSVFGLGNQLYQNVLTTILLCALISMAAMFVRVRQITRPVINWWTAFAAVRTARSCSAPLIF